jgi:hypothetical protein
MASGTVDGEEETGQRMDRRDDGDLADARHRRGRSPGGKGGARRIRELLGHFEALPVGLARVGREDRAGEE